MALKHKKYTSHHYHGLLTPAAHGAVTQKAHLPTLTWATNTTSDTQENMSTQGPTRQVRPTTQHKPVKLTHWLPNHRQPTYQEGPPLSVHGDIA